MSHHDIGTWQSRHLWFDKPSQRGYLRAQNPANYLQMQNSRKKNLLILGRLVISSASDFSTGWFSHPNMTIIDIFQVGAKESTERPEISPAVSSGYHCAQVAYQPHLSQRPLHHRWSRPGTQENFHLVSKGPHLPIFICSMCMKNPWYLPWHLPWYLPGCHIILSIFVHICPWSVAPMLSISKRPGRSGWCLSSLGAMYGDHQGWTTWSIGKIYRWTMVNNHHWKLVSWESCLSI